MDEKSEKSGQETVELLRQILKWIKFDGMQRVKGTLTDVLQKDVEKIIYEFSDGKSSIEIARIAGVSHQTVVNYWKRWSRIGIVEAERARGGSRYRRVFSLEDFGIEVPQPKENKKAQESTESTSTKKDDASKQSTEESHA
jgi:predicted transcriptional regulator